MVRRERLMNELIAKGRKAGIVVLYAPDGFGKTSVLLQYTHEVKCDPTRGPVRIIEADRATGREVFMQLEVVTEELKDKPHSLIAIDNVPNLDQLIPGLAAVCLTLLVCKLLKKKVSPIVIILALFAIGIIGRVCGFM